LRVLRTFCAAAATQSFREAAELLFLTSSAVSHQMKLLESELDRKLFARNSRSLTLTDDGKALYDDLRPVLDSLDKVVERHGGGHSRRSLRISVQPFFASEYFIPRLQEFVDLNPDIDINLDTSDESPEKHPDTADVSIRLFSSPPPTLSCDRLFQLCLVPAGSPELYDRVKVVGGRIVSELPLIIHNARPNAWKKWAKAARLRLPTDTATLRFDSITAAVRAAELGMGAALIPEQASQGWFESGRLVQLFERKVVTNDAYYLVCRPDDRDAPAVRPFREWVLENVPTDR
jgi:LysR family glycine cleavage system transcriptional activator